VDTNIGTKETAPADEPLVSVVIPTYRRPIEVQTAVHCALDQSFRELEVIVVVDGPHPETENVLGTIGDPRLRVVVNAQNQGLAESRNVGVRAARGQWVAFLDDDDLWFPTKIEKQVQIARGLGSHGFVVTRYLEKTANMERVWPETLPETTYRFSEYLFHRRGMLLPSTYMASKALMLDVPFTKGLRHIEDLDWLVRSAADPRTKIGAVSEPLAIYNNVASTGRESEAVPWQLFYTWAFTNRRYFTPLAYSLYVSKGVVPRARAAGASWREQIHLLSATLFLGSFSPKAVMFFLASCFFSHEAKRKIREMISPEAREARRRARSIEQI
jgi:glycosyltransferase involved in cell wall biosynthesis